MRKPTGIPAKLNEPKATDDSASPLDDYMSLRGLARKAKRSPTTMSAIVAELDLPFRILRGRKLYRFSALAERLREGETTLAEARRKKTKP